MYNIVGTRGIGKTYRLLELANGVKGVVICSNPRAMREKAATLGFTEIQGFISYRDSIDERTGQDTFIDDLELYAKALVGRDLKGYTYTIDNYEN